MTQRPAVVLSTIPVPLCPLCGNDSQSEIGVVQDSLLLELEQTGNFVLSTQISNRLVRCTNCKFQYLNPRLSDAALSQAYSYWYSQTYLQTQAGSEGDSARRHEFRQAHLARIARHTSPHGRLLDVGTGTGLFLTVAREAGW